VRLTFKWLERIKVYLEYRHLGYDQKTAKNLTHIYVDHAWGRDL